MTFQVNITSITTRIATQFRTIQNLLTGSPTGDLSGLSTTDKSNFIAAINEVKAAADAAAASGGQTETQVQDAINLSISNLVDSSPAALDTLNELAAALGDDPNFATTINAAIATKANTADVYTKTELGDPTTDYVAIFDTALTA